MQDVKREILKVFSDKCALVSFATITETGEPWVRYVSSVISEKDMSIRFSTFVNSRKVKHIKHQPEVHLTCVAIKGNDHPEVSLQIQGLASFSTDYNERTLIWNDELNTFFKSIDDPNLGVIKVEPYRIEAHTYYNNMPQILIWER